MQGRRGQGPGNCIHVCRGGGGGVKAKEGDGDGDGDGGTITIRRGVRSWDGCDCVVVVIERK